MDNATGNIVVNPKRKRSKWRGKFKTLKEYYAKALVRDVYPQERNPVKQKRLAYDPKYFEFDRYEADIDPDETVEDMEKYDAVRQQQEIIKCANSFAYFCHKYVKILHPLLGLIPFILYKYQRKVIYDYETNRFNIISKFRQGGLTTVTLLWGLWRCLFKLDHQVMLLSKTDREATDIGMIVDRAIENFPEWLKPKKDNNCKWNDHYKQFKETGGALKFYSPEAARGKAVTLLIVDEAAFIPDMETHWKAMWPVLSTGGSCALVSTVNGLGNWYEETYHGAKEERNKFHVIDLDYWEHPDYNDEEWVKEQRAQLGEKGFLQEVMRSFLGSGDTYIPAHIIGELDKQTRDNQPIRKLFKKWVNRATRSDDLEGWITEEENGFERGAMWIWKEPIDGHEYLIGADTAEGVGENGDNSCFQIIDTVSLEQVAEFYSDTIPPHVFSQVLNEVGVYYNNALIIIEDMAPGGAVLSNLQHEMFYENLYFDEKGVKSGKPGIKVGRVNRPLLLEAMQHRLLNATIRINSRRFVSELKTFEFNPKTKRAEAQKGKHDDAISAISIALYVRDRLLRDIPIGEHVPVELTAIFKASIYEDIKREIRDGAPSDYIDEDEDLLAADKDAVLPGLAVSLRPRASTIMSEFAWWPKYR